MRSISFMLLHSRRGGRGNSALQSRTLAAILPYRGVSMAAVAVGSLDWILFFLLLVTRFLNTRPMPLMITKLLFICSQNRCRSLTAETIAHGIDGFTARSAGTERGARIRVTEGHLSWADLIFVMEKRHIGRLRSKFPVAAQGKQ